MRGRSTGGHRVALIPLLVACVDAAGPSNWPERDYEAAFAVVLHAEGTLRSLQGPFAVDRSTPPPTSSFALDHTDRLVLLGLTNDALRAIPGAYDASIAPALRLVPEVESCAAEGRVFEADEEPWVSVPMPLAAEIFELDATTLHFVEASQRAPIDDWSLEAPVRGWCDAGPDVVLVPFETPGGFPEDTDLHIVFRVGDDRLLVASGAAAYLVETHRAPSDAPGRAVVIRERRGAETRLTGILWDHTRSTATRQLFIAWVSWNRRAEGALVELVLDETGLYEGRWVDLPAGPVWSALLEPDGRFFAVGGENVDPSDERWPPRGMVLTASTTAGPYRITPLENIPTRSLGRSPLPHAPHWVGTMDGVVLEGDLEEGLETFRASVPEAGGVYTLIALGTSEAEVVGYATTSVPTTLERHGGWWRKTGGLALPPRVLNCEAVAPEDACGRRRWSSPRTEDVGWTAHRPWEARYAPWCDVTFLWDARERCMRLAAPQLDDIDGSGRLLGSHVDLEGRRLTVVGSRGRMLEGWLTAP